MKTLSAKEKPRTILADGFGALTLTRGINMNSSTAPTVFQFHDHQVRTIIKDGEPWFIAADVCRALDYKNVSQTVGDNLDDDEKGISAGYTLGGEQQLVIISESGLYALVLRSRKPEARKFAKWVTSEVLPSIRKTGSYMSDSTRNNILGLCTHVEFLRSWWSEYGPAIRALAPDVAYRINDHFIDGASFSRNVARSAGVKVDPRIATYPWRSDSFAQRTHFEQVLA